MKIDTSGWKRFSIADIFETKKLGKKVQIPTGASVSEKDLKSGNIPRISASNFNNGIIGYFTSSHKNYRVYENFISVSFLGTVFYQESKASLDMKVHCLKPKDHELNTYTATFLVSVLRSEIGKILYDDQISSTSILKLSFMLPAKKYGDFYEPDYKYMQDFMQKIEKKVNDSFLNLQVEPKEIENIDLASWKEFSIDELGFIKYHGKRLKKADRIDGDTPFLTAGKENQGVATYVDSSKLDTYLNAITIDMFGNCFYHRGKYAGDDNIYFLVNHKLSENCKIFIACCINNFCKEKYDFSNQFRQSDLDSLAVLLPSKIQNDNVYEPDYEYMQSFIKNIYKCSKIELNILKF
ncbi:restriction endonuclease subunit S [Campylobacter sp. MG1]|uniref:restriction endonuclease subunit S n=1 Tax=Campylobacter sp. MG1 TaxID=2976332 RepID=UPI00226CDEA2|nr:restriction endonuclease subunit S [Campylobacter sp. MG1]